MVKNITPVYYSPWQHGNGLRSFKGSSMQKGYGLGGFFKGLARTFAPVLKQGLAKVGERVLNTGSQVIQDVSQGKSLKESVKQRAKQNAEGTLIDIKDGVKETIVSRKRTSKRASQKQIKKRKKLDIFD